MNTTEQTIPAGTLPNSEEFRDWLACVLAGLDVPALRVSRAAGLGPNTVGQFLRGGGITLDTAFAIQSEIQKIAAGQGYAVPGFIAGVAGDG